MSQIRVSPSNRLPKFPILPSARRASSSPQAAFTPFAQAWRRKRNQGSHPYRPALLRILTGFALLLAFTYGCRPEEIISSEPLDLRFSADTVYLDTVIDSIGSSTYQLKVYNDRSKTIRIEEIRLEDPGSPYRININGTPAQQMKDVEILPQDSLYIFVEVTTNIQGAREMLVTDKILFSSGGQQQDVELVTLAREGIFHFPRNFIVLGSGDNATVIPYSIIDCNTTWTSDQPHVVYGYAVIDSSCGLTIEPGTEVFFHQNSGLWVFDQGQLQIAPGATPGQVDSVVFTSDRLEPGFANDPGQWGGALGGLYIGQGAKASINYTVIKNATNAIRVDSATAPGQLQISNSYILNSSRTGLSAGFSHIRAENVVIANSGLYNLYAFGGNYEFLHCTFANYWTGSTRQEPAVLLTNFLEINDNGAVRRILRPLEQAYFGNCIIYGNNEKEIALAEDEGEQFNYTFNHALFRLPFDPEDRSINTADPEFTQVRVNAEPGFRDPQNNRYGLDSTSQAVDQGNVTDGARVLGDILGRSRNFNGRPDLGAFERQF